MSSDEQSDKECPLCMEPLEIDDINFYPCKCEYQICRFCWHRLRTDENGLCPACRQPYPEDPVNFKPLTASDVQKMKTEKRQKQQQQKIKLCESRKHLSSYRVLQKNLVYVVGLSARVADPETLKKPEYFGKYGRILKVAVGSSPSSNGPQSASCTAYVTYARYEDALRAIQAVNNAQLDGRIVKASLGTTKYCTNFLRSQPCHKPECMYLHDVADTEVSFTKDDMHLGRHAEYEKRLIESTLKEKSQRGRTSVVTNTGRKPSKSKSTERGPDGRLSATGNSQDRGKKIAQSRSPSGDKGVKKAVIQTNGEVSTNQSCSVINSKPTSENKGADKENEVRPLPDKPSKSAIEAPSSAKSEQQQAAVVAAVAPTVKINNEGGVSSRSRLSEWISPEQSIVPLIATTCGSIEKMFLNTKENMDTSNTKAPSDNISQTANASAPCDWQRALGISTKVENTAAKNTSSATDVPAALCSSQSRSLTRSTRLSVHSDDDLGFDPISESAKGLADLLEEERTILPQCTTQNMSGMTSVSSSLMSLGLQCGWPSMGITNGASPLHLKNPLSGDVDSTTTTGVHYHSCTSGDYFSQQMKFPQSGQPYLHHQQQQQQQPSSAFHTNQQQQQQQQQQQYSPHSYFPPSKPQMTRVGSFANPSNNFSFCSAQPQRCLSYGGGGSSTQYLSNLPPSATTTTGTSQVDGSKLHEWQEGFRALLPNVNVRFVPDLTTAGYPPSRTSPMDMQRTATSQFSSALSYDQAVPMPAQLAPANPLTAAAPPPIPSVNSYSHPAQQWMMPPPGFSYVSKR